MSNPYFKKGEKIKARYRKAGLSPFRLRESIYDFQKIEIILEKNYKKLELEKLAKDHTSKGYEFIEIVKI